MKGSESYHGISTTNALRTAIWLYGESDEAAIERGWSIEPRIVLAPNLSVLRLTPGELDKASTELAAAADITQTEVLLRATRGLYRFSYQADAMRDELQEMQELGIKSHIQKRPDLLNYPLGVILANEQAYVDMGIALADVRRHYKLYVYKPERIEARLDAFRSLTAAISPELPAQELEATIEEICQKPRLLVDNSERRLATYTRLVERFGSLPGWRALTEDPYPQAKGAPRQAALNNLLRADIDELHATMEVDPSQNIFVAARHIVNARKLAYKQDDRKRI